MMILDEKGEPYPQALARLTLVAWDTVVGEDDVQVQCQISREGAENRLHRAGSEKMP